MKKLMLTICLVSAFMFSSQAQIDLKINPIGVLFSSPDLAGEYLVNENLGVELSLGVIFGKVAGSGFAGTPDLKKSGYRVRISGKYYFNPDDGNDKFYTGLYLGPRSRKTSGDEADWGFDPGYKISAFTAGLLVGYKWVSDGGVVFEIGTGAGRAFGQKFEANDDTSGVAEVEFGLDFVGTIAVGYRIGG